MSDTSCNEHLHNLTPEKWEKLFALIPEIDQAAQFGETVFPDKSENGTLFAPYAKENKVVSRFRSVVHELDIALKFDWMEWTEGKELLNDPDTDYSSLDTETLCKLITVIIRSDRFSEGYLVICFENGTILKILKALEQKI